MTGTDVPKTQTTSPITARFQRFSPRWSALWAWHHLEPRSHRPRRGFARPAWRAPQDLLGQAVEPVDCGARGRRQGLAGL